jgi:predicted amidohydrolase
MKVALIQMTVVAGDVDANRSRGLAMAETAAAQAEIIVMPEIWTTGYALRQVETLAEEETGPTVSAIRELARKRGVTIVAGSLPLKRDGLIYNSSVVIGPQGETKASYDKIHLFSMTGEERFFAPGNRRVTFDHGGLTAGVAICYELRFPELFRSLTMDGAQVVFMPSEWPVARVEHWRTLTRARAIENQVYICAVNCVGEHRGSPFCGHSLLIGPTGDILADGGAEEGIIYGEINAETVAEARKNMQVWQDRRPEAYR